MLPIQILAPPEPDLDIDAKAARAFRHLVDDAKRFAMDFERVNASAPVISLIDFAMRSMASTLKSLSHRPVTQFYESAMAAQSQRICEYEAEIVRLRELVRQKDLTIQALGKAVAERELAGVR